MQGGCPNVSQRFAAAVALIGIWSAVTLSSCKPNPPQENSRTSGTPSSASRDTASPDVTPPILADWETPRAAIVFTGDIHGYMEPCGCAENQSGGFARRGGLLKVLREDKKWPTTALDVGGSLNEARITYPQTKIKFAVMLKGLNKMGYQGQALGREELMLGAQDLYTQYTQDASEPDFHVPFLSANTTIFGTKELGTPSETKVFEVGDLKVGVTSVVGKSNRDELELAGVTRDPNELLIQEAREVLPAALEKLKAESPDLLVLLSAGTIEESKALAQEFPDFNIVVTSGSVEDPKSDAVYIGKTLLVQVGKKGKNAAVVGVYPDNQFKYAVLALTKDQFPEDPAMHELMADYQNRLRENWAELSAQRIADPDGRQFIGAESCKECHTYAYGVWSESKHAHALDSLVKGRPGTEQSWVNRTWDPECLACHTTGWEPQKALRYQSGFVDLETTPHLAGQQCENCHGPGSVHASLEKEWKRGTPVSPEMKDARDAMRLTLTRAKSEVCLRCHDGDNSPNFDFDKYWPKVNHTGRKD